MTKGRRAFNRRHSLHSPRRCGCSQAMPAEVEARLALRSDAECDPPSPNLDDAQSAARLEQARAQLALARANYLPQITGSGACGGIS